MAAVGGAAADVVDRARGLRHQLAEAGEVAVGAGSPPPSQSSVPFANASASAATIGVGPAEPMQVPTVRCSGSSASANEQTAITIALRVPTLENCCGPGAGAMWKAAISSSGSSTLRLGPVMNSPIGTRRLPRALLSSSISALEAYSGGSASPAGEEEPRLPPIVPRLRICGEPTVREAAARPGSAVPSSVIARV